jgi:outer membrane protein insertion porin family
MPKAILSILRCAFPKALKPQSTAFIIQGNTKTHEQVARRELYTLPGDLFSKTQLMRSYRQLAQLGHFDQERIVPDVVPDQANGTVDIKYNLVERANDQVELSVVGEWACL